MMVGRLRVGRRECLIMIRIGSMWMEGMALVGSGVGVDGGGLEVEVGAFSRNFEGKGGVEDGK